LKLSAEARDIWEIGEINDVQPSSSRKLLYLYILVLAKSAGREYKKLELGCLFRSMLLVLKANKGN
jgi:hypothetical protein